MAKFSFAMRGKMLGFLAICLSSFLCLANQSPRAQPVFQHCQPDQTVEIVLSGEDADGDPLEYRLLDLPGHGKLLGSPPRLLYRPNDDFEGTDRFSFVVADPYGAFDIGFVEIRVSSAQASLRVLPRAPENFEWQKFADFLINEGVERWYVIDIPPRAFPPGLIPFVFVGSGPKARAFVVGPVEDPKVREVRLEQGYVWIDFTQASAGTYFLLLISGEEAFSYPLRIELPTQDRKPVV